MSSNDQLFSSRVDASVEKILPCAELLDVLKPAYGPCPQKSSTCSSLRWDPDCGYLPRGFIGATKSPDNVKLVLVFAEPGDPHDEKKENFASTLMHTYECMRNGRDLFHRNVREILNMCFPGESFDSQMEKTWMTESLLCSAPKECGPVASAASKACSSAYLVPQLKLLKDSVVVSLGKKALRRMRAVGITPDVAAGAVAPPGCNRKDARESWEAIAKALMRKS